MNSPSRGHWFYLKSDNIPDDVADSIGRRIVDNDKLVSISDEVAIIRVSGEYYAACWVRFKGV